MKAMTSILIAGVPGVVLEWCNGFLIHQLTGKQMFIWEQSFGIAGHLDDRKIRDCLD